MQYFQGGPKIEGYPKKGGGPRQLPHLPHPISTTALYKSKTSLALKNQAKSF